jgi:hypothetical protein
MAISKNPWLNHPLHGNPNPGTDASFVEYLRWMRILRENPDGNSQVSLVNNGEVLELWFFRIYRAKLLNPVDKFALISRLTGALSLNFQPFDHYALNNGCYACQALGASLFFNKFSTLSTQEPEKYLFIQLK